MKFALLIRGQYPQGADMVARHQDDLAMVRRAEALGFDAVGRASHYSSHPYQMLQQIPFLAQCAAIAPTLRLISGVLLLPMHKPLDVAEQLATLDVMSGGKLVFGAGVGYREVEFKAFGTTRKESGRRFEENLEAIKRLWTEDFVTMSGSHFELDGAICTVKPVQKPMPPIWIGANADIGIRRAARVADSWLINPHNTLATLDRQMEVYRRELYRCGKPFPAELPILRETFVARSREEAIRLARPALEEKYKAYRAWGQDTVMPEGDNFGVEFEELLDDRFLLGTADEVAEQILALQKRFGVNYFCVSVHLAGTPKEVALEQMQILAEEVFPKVAESQS
jgi:alkanesulfonate monooxygenase SsuD/methylene tetrahydromethanopterin reductase-like flavin-dependent oxidoreductase (luciferase family)